MDWGFSLKIDKQIRVYSRSSNSRQHKKTTKKEKNEKLIRLKIKKTDNEESALTFILTLI